MNFYLGTHMPAWLFRQEMVGIPLFVSRRTLDPLGRKSTWKRAVTTWALDSGGFQELDLHGTWKVPPAVYVEEVRRCAHEIGSLDFAAIQDWMCEPRIREKTGMSVEYHQHRTIESYRVLSQMAPDVPWIPVLQGWSVWQYHAHVEMYDKAGVDLRTLSTVGVGSVCRRQGTHEAAGIMTGLASYGIRLHGFGFKKQGLKLAAGSMVSSDSLAWSYMARREAFDNGANIHRLCSDPSATHQNCANCMEWALSWRRSVLETCK